MTITTLELVQTSPTSALHQREDLRPTTYNLTYTRPTKTTDLQLNRVSNREVSSSEAETLPLAHCGSRLHKCFQFATKFHVGKISFSILEDRRFET
ncbi:hypothetical protein AVEN_191385-1 [Araneus ventricosus]|uniref:Uncharacterized protein n=1 Tax=Araneus ventricosus TaxID=182803 RepID=A0A4Y2M8Q1_ARAVE|nr:hypothetical protein AVEN_191385-1 [Araneus ventricosus]